MKKLLAVNLFALSLAFVSPAVADDLRETYIARLSARDHVNSNGQRLESAAAIIRQDRANFHKFGRRDAEDESDSFFAGTGNRALLEKFLERGSAEPGALRAILYGTPLVRVRVFTSDDTGADYIRVTVLADE